MLYEALWLSKEFFLNTQKRHKDNRKRKRYRVRILVGNVISVYANFELRRDTFLIIQLTFLASSFIMKTIRVTWNDKAKRIGSINERVNLWLLLRVNCNLHNMKHSFGVVEFIILLAQPVQPVLRSLLGVFFFSRKCMCRTCTESNFLFQ